MGISRCELLNHKSTIVPDQSVAIRTIALQDTVQVCCEVYNRRSELNAELFMVANHENERSGASPDAEFTPPTRQQWLDTAVAGLGSGDTDALHDTRHTAKDLAKTNRRILQGLAGGITSIELRTNNPATIASSLNGVQLDIAPVSLRTNMAYQSGSESLVQLAKHQRIAQEALRCSLNADPVGSWLQTGTLSKSITEELQTMAKFTRTTGEQLPLSTSVLVDACLHHNAGASTVEELHAALATATLYLETLLNEGISINEACRQIVFQMAMDTDVMLEIAKIRALRALWRHVVLQIDNTVMDIEPAAIVAETSQRFISQMEPWNNHLRNLAASTAAAMANVDSLIVHPHDALQRKDNYYDTTLGDRMARNIAIILERECGLRKVHDPMAGAYAIENLTEQLMQHTWQSLADTDTSAGWLDELQSGRWKAAMAMAMATATMPDSPR